MISGRCDKADSAVCFFRSVTGHIHIIGVLELTKNTNDILSEVMIGDNSIADCSNQSLSHLENLLGHDLFNTMCNYGGYQLKDDFAFRSVEANPMSTDDGFDTFDMFLTLRDIDDMIKTPPGGMDYLDPDMLPIADVSGGDALCVCTNGSMKGSIYYWYHGNDMLDSSGYDIMYLVERSFDAFVRTIVPHDMTPDYDVSNAVLIMDDDMWNN